MESLESNVETTVLPANPQRNLKCLSRGSIDEATNGVEALQRVRASFPDLIFMDIRLPGKRPGTHPNIKAIHPELSFLFSQL